MKIINGTPNDPLRNPKDPLHEASPLTARDLFREVSRQCSGHPNEHVLDVAANLIVNLIRQAHHTRGTAEVAFDDFFGKTKSVLMSHYDSFGRRKGLFPYDQHLVVDLFTDRDGFRK